MLIGPVNGSPGASSGRQRDWPVYGGNHDGNRYSPLSQIKRSNVARLRQVWRLDGPAGGLQTHPLVIGRTLYAYSATQEVFAADAATGTVRWTFNSGIVGRQPARGLAWWRDGAEQRLFAGVMHRLYALDPATGKVIASFGDAGSIDLRKDLGGDHTRQIVFLTSPGVVFRDTIIVGFRTNETKPAAPGWIRAYDVRTGKLRWTFRTIPLRGAPGSESWDPAALNEAGGANNWAGMVVDQRRGIVFVPTGSAVDDMYGGDRKGANLYSNCLLALDAKSGRLLWSFQGVHHDLWDRDFPSPPVLLTVKRGARPIDAVAQASKQGFLFVFDRATGKTLFPIEERPFPASDVPGEAAWPTQPVPLLPAPFARQRLTEDMLTRRTPQAHAWAVKAFRKLRGGGPFVPLSVGYQTIVFPGFDGGAEWGGQAVDPRTGVLYLNSNDIVWTGGLVARGGASAASAESGADVYLTQCASCHGVGREGSPPQFPSLIGLDARMDAAQVTAIIESGRGRMPGFPHLRGKLLAALVTYARTGAGPASGSQREAGASRSSDTRYVFSGYRKFLDPDGYPAVAPPWGTLNAIDLNTGKYLWKIPLGEYPELAKQGVRDTGSENYGGPIVTGGGIVIIGATIFDAKIRAFDARTGEKLWEAQLPYAGNATPVTYMIDGRQYVLIATSNGKNPRATQGSSYVAFALPQRSGRKPR